MPKEYYLGIAAGFVIGIFSVAYLWQGNDEPMNEYKFIRTKAYLLLTAAILGIFWTIAYALVQSFLELHLLLPFFAGWGAMNNFKKANEIKPKYTASQ